METRSPRARTSFPLKTLLFLPVPLLFLTVSVSQLRVTMQAYDLLYAARLIDSGKPVSIDYIDTLLDTMKADDIPCRHDVVTAVMTTRFHTLDRLNAAATNPEKWQKALDQAGQFVRRGLACFPTDGGLWLRLAVVRWAGDAPAADVAMAMTQSQQSSPVETAPLLGRIEMWNRMSRAAIQAAEPAARADITTYDAYFRAIKPKALLTPSPALADLMASVGVAPSKD
ncbi:hypothetical protein [Rhizobium sp. Leaf341]|uniref:hypothetical protein n=1 Tax=Rhizobium sp. Leaf341 TaxID=1736344 RepID=UPI000715DCF7|nr:hypothetical protein [Rhizobium sp. Leaf341]KQR70817.1 hypothetical protein ASG03_04330 [Rhizobium sp. Leaf341]